jgi:hypothetical protein
MGCNVQLLKFHFTLQVVDGVAKIVVKRLDSDCSNFCDLVVEETTEEESHSSLQFTENSEFAFLSRGQSFENERGCDEIM